MTRQAGHLIRDRIRTELGGSSTKYAGATLWNNISKIKKKH